MWLNYYNVPSLFLYKRATRAWQDLKLTDRHSDCAMIWVPCLKISPLLEILSHNNVPGVVHAFVSHNKLLHVNLQYYRFSIGLPARQVQRFQVAYLVKTKKKSE